jgi:GT2 family glycosyltransferase
VAKQPSIDVIIPSFNARYLLEKNLPNIVENTDNIGNLIVIDNGSEDDTVKWLEENHPRTIIVRNKTNLGYTKPVNQGIAKSNSEFFILINNDVRPRRGYTAKVMTFFDDPEVFAVSFNEEGASWPEMSWAGGKMQFTHGKDKSKPVLSAWASGGSAIFRRSIWNELGGLDEIYAPFYWEDIDIGYRAWKSGYKIIWEPSASVIHDHESTSKKLDPHYISLIKQRNELLFNWLNVKEPRMVFGHLIFLITHSLRHPGYLRVVWASLWRFMTHSHLKRNFIISDLNVLSHISKSI